MATVGADVPTIHRYERQKSHRRLLLSGIRHQYGRLYGRARLQELDGDECRLQHRSGCLKAATATALPAAPTNLTAAVETGPQVLLDWTDNANNETSFVIERAVGAGAFSVLASVGANTTTYTDLTVVPGNNYSYRVAAANAGGPVRLLEHGVRGR